MNKMNLPPPFEELEGDFPILKELYDIENYQDLFGIPVASQNTDGISVLRIIFLSNKVFKTIFKIND